MDKAFLDGGVAGKTRRMLVLNNLDNLGRELTVAQMSGKVRAVLSSRLKPFRHSVSRSLPV